ncbi:MAG: class beta-lactamase-related serine hydrolase [Alphaproteobacteria bacterium]|nr:class beta-lactamase-related serine hydrolase [Alphaproteobacteria bacterium]
MKAFRRAALFFLLLLPACATIPAARPPAAGNYAWATFDARGIAASGASGLADRTAGRRLTIDDPVRIASITKLHVGLGVMRLVEHHRLDLNRDVSDYLGWPLRNPAFPDRPITLRLLLSHRSSLRDGIDYALPLGATLRQALGAPEAWDKDHPPGTYFRYANLGFPVVASVMEAATGERFDRLMDRLVIRPLRLDACFNWTTCSEARVARAVVLYAPDGSAVKDDLHGRGPACPVVPAADGSCAWETAPLASNGALLSPQGGLRISVRDLAKVGQMLLRNGRLPGGGRFLSEASLSETRSLAWRFDGANGDSEQNFYCGYGLAMQVLGQCPPGDDPFGDGRPLVGHAGDAYGLRSGLWIDRARGIGIAYFATGLGDDPPRGRSAYRVIEEWLAAKLKRR